MFHNLTRSIALARSTILRFCQTPPISRSRPPSGPRHDACADILLGPLRLQMSQSKFKESAQHIYYLNERLKISPSAKFFSNMLRAPVERGDIFAVESIIDLTKRSGLRVLPSMYRDVLKCYARAQKTAKAESFFEILRKEQSLDVYIYTQMIDMFGTTGDIDTALWYWKDMLAAGIVPTDVSYISLIKGYTTKLMFAEAKGVITDMMSKGVPLNPHVFNSLLLCAARKGDLNEVNNVWKWMRSVNVEPNDLTFNILVRAAASVKNMQVAQAMWLAMTKRGFVSDRATYNVLIEGFARQSNLKQCHLFAAEMVRRGFDHDALTYSHLIRVELAVGSVERGRELFAKAKNDGKLHNSKLKMTAYSHILFGLCLRGLVDIAVSEYLPLMKAEGLQPYPAIYASIIASYSNLRRQSDAEAMYEVAKTSLRLPEQTSRLVPLLLQHAGRKRAMEFFKEGIQLRTWTEVSSDNRYSIDLHGYTRVAAQAHVIYHLDYLHKAVVEGSITYNNIRSLIFITGRGAHSDNDGKGSVIRYALEQLVKKFGYSANPVHHNEGRIYLEKDGLWKLLQEWPAHRDAFLAVDEPFPRYEEEFDDDEDEVERVAERAAESISSKPTDESVLGSVEVVTPRLDEEEESPV